MIFDRFLQEAALLEGLAWRKYRRRSMSKAYRAALIENPEKNREKIWHLRTFAVLNRAIAGAVEGE